MSRVGKQHITIPEGVTLNIDNNVITVTGPLGKLTRTIETPNIKVSVDGKIVSVTRTDDEKQTRAYHGLYRMLIANMVTGVKEGYKKYLTVNGVGCRLQKVGNKLIMNIGYSKPKEVVEVEGIKIDCENNDTIIVSGIDKELVGQIAAKIKAIKPVEPYHLYGIRYRDEVVVKKEIKKVGKK